MSRLAILGLILSVIGNLTFAQSDSLKQNVVLDGAYIHQKSTEERLINWPFWSFTEDPIIVTKQEKLPKPLLALRNGFVLFTGASFITGSSNLYTPTKEDTSLLFFNQYRKTSVPAFALSKFEVTNREYREFVAYVRDSCMRDILYHAGIKGFGHPIIPDINSPFPSKDYILNYETLIDMEREDIFDLIYNNFYWHGGTPIYYDRQELVAHKLKYRYATGKGLSEDNNEYLVAIYPDTTSWTKEFLWGFMEPLEESYFWHPAYDQYPVVGLNIQQVQAYCHWRSLQLEEKLKQYPQLQGLIAKYRLPTNEEWEYAKCVDPAILKIIDEKTETKLYRKYSKNFIIDHNSVNMGQIRDVNDFYAAVYHVDDFDYTCPVEAMSPDNRGLFHLRGNVAEWTSSTSEPSALFDTTFVGNNFNCKYLNNVDIEIDSLDNIESIREKLRATNSPPKKENLAAEYDEILTRAAETLLHDYSVHNSASRSEMWSGVPQKMYIVRGGSWADSPVYSELKELYSETTTSSHIGFRMVLEISREAIPYLVDDEYPKDMKEASKK